ncbi:MULTISPECIES: IS3 family transposase [Paenibacillus]
MLSRCLTCQQRQSLYERVREYITYYISTHIQAKLNYQSPMGFRRLAA